MPIPSTIEEVLERLDEIIAASIAKNDPIGYFAYVYRRTTAAVRAGILSGRFEEAERMEKFDVDFANIYLKAYQAYAANEPCAASWQLAFDEARNSKAILQHVLLGMNAHINLDLGVAAGVLMKGKPLEELSSDFHIVNDILNEITAELEERIGRVSPLFSLATHLSKGKEGALLDFSMRAAREQAWVVAQRVWEATDETTVVARVDGNVYRFGSRLARPRRLFIRTLWKVVAFFEANEVGDNLEAMRR